MEAYRKALRLIREKGRHGAGYLCACIADRVLDDGNTTETRQQKEAKG